MARHKVIRSPRLARKEKKRKAQKIIFFALLSLVLLVAAMYGFSRPVFRITEIDVSGSSRVPEANVIEAVRQGIAGTYFGFIPKAHTLLYPKTALKEELIKEFPAFSKVSLSLGSLAALHVAVREREPQALWCAGVSGCFLVDETGFAFAPADLGTEKLYYRFEKEATSSPLGTEVMSADRLAASIAFLKELEKLGFNPERLLLEREQDVEVVLSGNARLLLKEGDYAHALTNLQTLLTQGDVLPLAGSSLKVEYIDLRYGNKIYFKPK